MAQYFWRAADHPLGDLTGWTSHTARPISDWEVIEHPDGVTGKVLRCKTAAGNALRVITLDGVVASATVEIATRVHGPVTTVGSREYWGSAGRVTGSGASLNAVIAIAGTGSINTATGWYVSRYINGSEVHFVNGSRAWMRGAWHTAIFSLSESTRRWRYLEGVNSDYTSTNADPPTGAGLAGIYLRQPAADTYYQWIGIGTDGDPAPTAPLNARPAAPTVTVSGITATGVQISASAYSDLEGDARANTQVRVRRTSDDAIVYGPVTLGALRTWPHAATGLPSNTSGLVAEVRDSDAGGYGAWGTSAPFVTPVLNTAPSITIDQAGPITLAPGETAQLTATVTDAEDDPDPAPQWSSSAPSVATVSGTGLVTAIAVGSATITATAQDAGGLTASATRVVNVAIPAPTADEITAVALSATLVQVTLVTPGTGADSRALRANGVTVLAWAPGRTTAEIAVAPGSTTPFVLVATNAGGSTPSNTASVTTPAATVRPNPPTLSVPTIGTDQALLAAALTAQPAGINLTHISYEVASAGGAVLRGSGLIPLNIPGWEEFVAVDIGPAGSSRTAQAYLWDDAGVSSLPVSVPFATLAAPGAGDRPAPVITNDLGSPHLREYPYQTRGVQVAVGSVGDDVLHYEVNGRPVFGGTVVGYGYLPSNSIFPVTIRSLYVEGGEIKRSPPGGSAIQLPITFRAPYSDLRAGVHITALLDVAWGIQPDGTTPLDGWEGHPGRLWDGALEVERSHDDVQWASLDPALDPDRPQHWTRTLDPAELPGGPVRLRWRVVADDEDAPGPHTAWRYGPVQYVGMQDAITRLEGDDLAAAQVEYVGVDESARWQPDVEGLRHTSHRDGGLLETRLGIVSFPAFGTPRVFELVFEYQTRASDPSGTYGGLLLGEPQPGVALYVSDAGDALSAILVQLSNSATAAWHPTLHAPGGSYEWWRNLNIRHGRSGSGVLQVRTIGPGASTMLPTALRSSTPQNRVHHHATPHSAHGIALDPWYSARVRCTLLGTLPDGQMAVLVEPQRHGPECDHDIAWEAPVVIRTAAWPCGAVGLLGASRKLYPYGGRDSHIRYRSLTVVVHSYGDCLVPPVLAECEADTFAGVAQLETSEPEPILFPPLPDWAQRVDEGREYLTSVIEAEDDSEQRIRLRTHPRRSIRYVPLMMDAQEAGYVDSLLWRNPAGRWWVPLWFDASAVAEPVEAGAETVACDTADRGFVAGGKAVLWLSVTRWELVDIQDVTPEGLLLAAAADGAWPAGETLVIPVRRGRLRGDPRLDRAGRDVSSSEVTFDLEPETALMWS